MIELESGICYNCQDDGAPVVFDPVEGHVCRRELIGECPNCKDTCVLDKYFLCSQCGTLPVRSTVRQKADFRVIVAYEKQFKSFGINGLRELPTPKRSRPSILVRFWSAARTLVLRAAQ